VRGARAGVSWDNDTLFTGYRLVSMKVSSQFACMSRDTCGVAEFLLDSLVERRAIVSDAPVQYPDCCEEEYCVRLGETICDLPVEEWTTLA
jgi:hypothetical protein